jgi:exosome complex component RRP43
VPNIDFPAVSSSEFKPGPPSELAQRMTEAIHQILIRSIDVESLCIQEKVAVWVLYVDIACLCYDGNAFDAACLSMVAALKNSKTFLAFIQQHDYPPFNTKME